MRLRRLARRRLTREYIPNMRVWHVGAIVVGMLVGGAIPAHAQMAIGSVGGAFVPAGGTSNLSSGPVSIPGDGSGVLAIPSSGARTLAPSGARPLSPPPRGPQPSGLVTVPLPLVASPYLTQPKVNPCLATYASSKCGSLSPATATYPSGRIK